MDPFRNVAAAKAESTDTQVKEQIAAFIDALPEEFKAFILAKLEEDETGTMPLPPMPGGLFPMP